MSRAARKITAAELVRWRREPCTFIEEELHDPETGKPFKLLDAERDFLAHAFKTDDAGKLLYPEQVYADTKEVGKDRVRRPPCLDDDLAVRWKVRRGNLCRK